MRGLFFLTNIKDITLTEARAKNAVNNTIQNIVGPTITQEITSTVENERIRTGVITKFYHYLDKAEVELDNADETVLCKILHRFGGGLIDYYTPESDSLEFDDVLHEPYYKPRGPIHCLIININDEDSEEYLILGFYQNEELIQINPAAPGNIKIVARTGNNQYWIKFGADGLDLRLPYDSTTNVGDRDENMHKTSYADADNVYTKQEVYTKEEVDELIADKIREALGE